MNRGYIIIVSELHKIIHLIDTDLYLEVLQSPLNLTLGTQ